LAEQALARGDAAVAVAHVEAALNPPGSLGETRQPLADPARLSLAMGIAWTRREITTTRSGTGGEAAASRGGFAEMSPPDFSENIINQLEAAGSLR
jgi:hypothetical protein